MILTKNERFKESYVSEVLDNGLQVVLFEKPGFHKSHFMMATPFGGSDSSQLDDKGIVHQYPHGVAHFLEHKMFEKEGQDVLEEFSAMGANVNAFTSYTETAYYFSTTKNPIQPLNLLLDFVQELTISEDSVEKEKGIIVQELEMYKQMSDSRLISESMEAIFHYHPLRNDIGGDEASVNSITYDVLQECYRLNYHPQKMILVGVSSMDSNVLLHEIKKNQANKTFDQVYKVQKAMVEEPVNVFIQEKSLEMDISTTKASRVYKMQGIKDPVLANKMEWCFRILLNMKFSPLNEQYQEWIDLNIINDAFGYDVEVASDYALLLFTNEGEKMQEFHEMIDTNLKDLATFEEQEITNLKRRYFGSNIKALNSFENTSIGFMRCFFQDLDFFEGLEIVESITKQDLLLACEWINVDNFSKITIRPKAS